MLDDVRFFFRLIRRQKCAFGVVVGMLAVAIGSTTAIVLLADALVLRPLPVRDLHRLVSLGGLALSIRGDEDAVAWWGRSESLQLIANYQSGETVVQGTGGHFDQVRTTVVSADFFAVFQLDLHAGRGFGPQDEVEGHHQVVVLSYSFWRSYFDGRHSALGAQLRIRQIPYTVAGVAPPGFEFPAATQLWVPRLSRGRMPFAIEVTGGRSPVGEYFGWVARLRSGASPQQARDELYTLLQVLGERYREEYSGHAAGEVIGVTPLRRALTRDIQAAASLFLFGGGLILLLASVNCATFLLGKATTRRQEIAVRQVLGASSGRLLRQMLTETAALAVLSGILGYVVATWAFSAIPQLFPEYAPFLRTADFSPPFVFGVSLLVAMASGLAVGLLPALQSSSTDLSSPPRSGSGTFAGRRGKLLRRLFLGAEVALALVLCVGALWSLGAFLGLARLDLGYDTRNVFSARLSFPGGPLGREQFFAVNQDVEEAAKRIRGIGQVALARESPVYGAGPELFVRTADTYRSFPATVVTGGYFSTLGIPLLSGRTFRDVDREVVIVSERTARILWPWSGPIGKSMWFDGERTPREVIGVARDTQGMGLNPLSGAQVYLPYSYPYRGAASVSQTYLIVRCRESCSAATPALLSAVNLSSGHGILSRVALLEDQVKAAMAPVRISAVLFSAYALLALGLAVGGVYALTSYLASMRAHEIGVRMALGAGRGDVAFLIMGEGVVVSSIGILLGGWGAFVSAQVMSAMIGIAPPPPITMALVGGGLFLSTVVASLAPSLRAARGNPGDLLRVT